ncbi:MAG: hypothetical protein H9W81_07695 [Enterococcus sp.]|nr:hypothetical protein [Enterococcus sp.]
MSKPNIFATALIAFILGVVGFTTYDPSPVTYPKCEVTGTHQSGGGKTSVKHYIETTNCGELWASKTIAKNIEPGKIYNFIGTGIFSWEKKVTEAKVVKSRPPKESSKQIGPGLGK